CRIQVCLLQAALAEAIRDGNAVCYDTAADLLGDEIEPVLHISVQASHRFRCLQAQEHLKLRGPKAERHLYECDRRRRRWLVYLLGTKGRLPRGYDLLINSEQDSLDECCRTASDVIQNQSRFCRTDLARLEDFVVSSRIKASLALDPNTAHLDVDVDIVDHTARLRGTVRTVEELDSIKRVSFPIPAGIKVDCSQLQLGGADYTPYFFPGRAVEQKPESKAVPRTSVLFRPAWAVTLGLLMIVFVVAGSWIPGRWFSPPSTHLLKLAGIITDSKCGGSRSTAQQTPECVRTCVRVNGEKYVLNDGRRNLVLVDQQTGARFAGQRVVASGFRDEITGALQLYSIRAVRR
ncbi:MAG TPA: BON domain-containing protein, partial [Terriglobales bacterium]|nr:BON domain-containing protein [Terriglobales bacterium]